MNNGLAMSVLGAVGVLAALLVCPVTSHAQDISYQATPIGDRAVGMGGAYTGVAEDASAVWYNPGGLAFQEDASVSGALSLRIFSTYHIEDGFGLEGDTADLDDQGTTTIPFFVGGMAKLGPEDDPALRRHALAAAAVNPVVPSQRFQAAVNPSSPAGSTVAAALNTESRTKLQYFGPSYAYRINDHLGVGISAYLSLHDYYYQESETVSAFDDRQPDGTFMSGAVASRISGGKAFVASLLFRVGLAWQPTDDLAFGLMLQAPNLPLIRDGEVSEFRTQVGPDGSGAFTQTTEDTTPGLSQPWEARLGIGYRPLPHWHLAFDASVYSPVGSADDPAYLFGETTPDPATGRAPSPGRFIANEFAVSAIANFAIGAETIIADVVPLAFGVYSDFSPSRGVHEPSATYTPPRMDSVGLTGVVGYRRGGYNVAVGATLLLGWGAAYGTNPDPMATERYVPRPSRQSALYLFITGYSGAAEQLAQDVGTMRMTDEQRAERDRRDAEEARLEELRRQCEERLASELLRNDDGDDDGDGDGDEPPPVPETNSTPEDPADDPAEDPADGPATPSNDGAPAEEPPASD